MTQVRFTVLTPRLIRCEWHPDGQFEDRPTQWVVSRDFPPVAYTISEQGGGLTLRTAVLELVCRTTAAPFSRATLEVRWAGSDATLWRYGDTCRDSLGGTSRTLDDCDGAIRRSTDERVQEYPGIFSRSGWGVVDDSASMPLDASSLPRESAGPPRQDLYFFAYGDDYAAGLRDFYRLTGAPPVLPYWALGIWWSRWEKYTADDLRGIVAEFEEHEVPLSTLVIDMDWHLTENLSTSGWTGYTWNRAFFPDPEGFFADIHRKGIRACLNLHPADGVHPHEEAYEAFARFMGQDPASGTPVLFNPTDARFWEGYFRFLHHPHEETGVDFWWIDWQQGKKTPFGPLDPLWILNHLHCADRGRDGNRRPLTFSRWCGPGAHRYPIGFSGDTFRTWRTLQHLVTFTARASNLGFGWWSHDVDGFARGVHDDERYLRWVQYCCLSPVFRFHNAGDPTVDNRPWTKEPRIGRPALAALRLRRALRPYLYRCAHENGAGGLPLVRPLYYHGASEPESYCWPRQYFFGPDLLAAPVVEALDPQTGVVLHPVWLPAGEWRDFFTGAPFDGGRVHGIVADLTTVPLFVRSGALLPVASESGNGIDAICYAGGEGSTDVYLDDGDSMGYRRGDVARYRLTQTRTGDRWHFRVERCDGLRDQAFRVSVVLRGYDDLTLTDVTCNGESVSLAPRMRENGDWVVFVGDAGPRGVALCATVAGAQRAKPLPTREGLVQLLRSMPINCHFARPLSDAWEEIAQSPACLSRYVSDLADAQIRVLVAYLYDAGYAVSAVGTNEYQCVWWCGRPDLGRVALRLSWRTETDWERFYAPVGTPCGSFALSHRSAFHSWRVEADLLGVATLAGRRVDARDRAPGD